MSDLERVEALTLLALDGEASAEEREELAALVASDGEAFERHCALLDLEATLRGHEAPADLATRTMDRVRQAQADRVSAGVMDKLRQRVPGDDDDAPAPADDGPAPAAGDEPLPASTRRILGWGAAAALVALLVGAALALGYHLGRSGAERPPRTRKTAELRTTPDDATRARIDRAENEVRKLRQQIAAQRAADDANRKQSAQERERTRNAIAALRKELSQYVEAQKALVQRGTADAWSDRSQVSRVRTQLKKLQELRDKVRALEKQVPVEQLQVLQQLLAEIRKHASTVRAMLRVARKIRRRPARRRLALPGRRPSGTMRAAAAFDDAYDD